MDSEKLALQTYAIQDKLGLSDKTAEQAIQLFEQYRAQSDDLYGWSLERTVVACLYIAARVYGEGVVVSDFVNAIGDDDADILHRRVRTMTSELGLNPAVLFDPAQYVDRVNEELDVSEKTVKQAKVILEHGKETGVSGGKNPRGQAGAAVYIASLMYDGHIGQKEIGDVLDISSLTIRNRYQELLESGPPAIDHNGIITEDDMVVKRSTPSHRSGPKDGEGAEDGGKADGKVSPPSDLIADLASTTGLSESVGERSEEIFLDAQELSDFSLDEIDRWVAASVQLASEREGMPADKSELAAAAGIDPGVLESLRFKLGQSI